MGKAVRKKKSYGGCTVDHLSPAVRDNWPKAINIVLGLEETLKLQLAIQDRLLVINGLNRSTREGKAAAVNLCLYPQARRITVNADKLRSKQNADT
jgi:hypothetical protein